MFLILMLGSCEKVIEFKGAETEPKIVLYSNLQSDSIISCQVGLSYPVFEPEYSPEQIQNAIVKLYKNDVLLEILTYKAPPERNPDDYYYDEQYLSEYRSVSVFPEYSAEYKIEVSLPGYQTVQSVSSLPQPVSIIKIDTQLLVINDYGWEYMKLNTKIKFIDPPDEKNYYRLLVLRQNGRYPEDKSIPYNSEIPVLISRNYSEYFESNDPLLNPSENEGLFENSGGNEYHLFSDEIINGKEYDLSFDLTISDILPSYSHYEFIHFTIYLQSISKDYYYYLSSYSKHKNAEGEFLTEPVLVYSNIENGLGVFGAASSAGKMIEFGAYPVNGVEYMDENEYWWNK